MIKDALNGFKTFILRGNVIDLAVGVVIGASFSALVQAFVKDMLTPFIAAIAKSPDFSGLSFTIRGSTFMYGDFLNALISFLIVASTVYFFVVLPMNKLYIRFAKGEEKKVNTKQCPECMSDIPLHAMRCPQCTQKIT